LAKCSTRAPRCANGGEDGLIAVERDVLAVVTAILHDEEANVRDRLKAAELMGKRHGLFTDRLDVGVSVDVAGALGAARERAKDAR
jgi:hypothetical protein